MQKISPLKLVFGALLVALISSALTYFALKQIASPTIDATIAHSLGIAIPQNNCEIRTWYNFQVVAIPKLNESWIEKGISLEERAKKAFSLRHNARKNARYMMQNKEEVKTLNNRDQEIYGHPDGPTFEFLVNKNRDEGKSETEIYESIIESASRTNTAYNADCD